MSCEMNILKSGLDEWACDSVFPQLPCLPAKEATQEEVQESLPPPPQSDRAGRQQSQDCTSTETATWYFYLTDISLRRLINRINEAFYALDHVSWQSRHGLPSMLKIARELEDQLASW